MCQGPPTVMWGVTIHCNLTAGKLGMDQWSRRCIWNWALGVHLCRLADGPSNLSDQQDLLSAKEKLNSDTTSFKSRIYGNSLAQNHTQTWHKIVITQAPYICGAQLAFILRYGGRWKAIYASCWCTLSTSVKSIHRWPQHTDEKLKPVVPFLNQEGQEDVSSYI